MRKSLRLLLAGLLFLFLSPIVSRARGSTGIPQADDNVTSLSRVTVSIYGTETGSQQEAEVKHSASVEVLTPAS